MFKTEELEIWKCHNCNLYFYVTDLIEKKPKRCPYCIGTSNKISYTGETRKIDPNSFTYDD